MTTAAWCERAAALLGAGLPSTRVIELLGPPPESDGGAIRVAWQLCVQQGAALSSVLHACAEAAREWDRIAAERASALAGPKAAARLVAALPIVALVMGMVFGLNPLPVLFGSVLGWCCAVLGGVALVLGWRWTNRLVHRAAQAEPAPGLCCELSAQLIAAGLPAPQAISRVDAAWLFGSAARDDAMVLAQLTGMPPVRALRAEAAAERADAAARGRLRAAELAVQLTLPLGVCVLPAFIFWGVLPLLLSVMRGVAPMSVVVP